MHTRFHGWYSAWLSSRSPARAATIPSLLEGFAPDAVLTVAHGHLWVTAAEFAERHRLPLHFIVHDDWPRVARVPRLFTDRIDGQFGHVYRCASSRLCVSPFMAEEYRRRYGALGRVLYPSRGKDARPFDGPSERLREQGRGIVCVFAGTINTPDYVRLLRTLAACLEQHQGRLLIFGPLTADQATRDGLDKPNIELRGLLDSNDLIGRLRAEADVLFVPMSFAATDRPNMEISFPSKLTDYTAVGLPLLIVGPPYCAAARWACENPGVAELVDTDDMGALGAAIQHLTDSPEHRVRLATAAVSVGGRCFSHASAQEQLFEALRQPWAA